ncbi:penicillin-binding protein 2 [Glaciecola punicea ACAM 611]|uniref:Peptidoglycan D,D-transpeptidase MrdA n=1 Tax=Glaciecola punicea ACAM 611 TaxID=1121923 RepID=H5TAC6_9ALTE|nr:penicillin-binding protein 2 [Glaciecola punicea]GAB55253.1 penicillin-binding protein 2 [Glaciecola punicea ACAM 611]
MAKARQTIRDHSAEANLFARRAFFSAIFVFGLMSLLLINLYDLQVNKHLEYQTQSNGNRIKVLPVAPNRGLIYDRNGVILAENKSVFSLEIIPEEVDNLEQTLAQLTELMAITPDEIARFEKDKLRQRRFKPVSIRRQLTHEEVALFSANQHRFPGIDIKARLSRYYPFKDTLTHMLGYVSRINKRDLAKLKDQGQEANYAATHDIGKQGVEKFHESKLHGRVGYQQVEVNNKGRIIRVLDFEPPEPGKDIVLNIDIKLQQKAQQEMAGRRGSVIITDVKTGGVLALYSSPSYDPNMFVHGISQTEYSKLLNSRYSPLLNRATQGLYPPASLIKPHLALIGLEEGVITPETEIQDRGFFKLRNVAHIWRDWKRQGHGTVDVTKAIEVSCDTFYYELAYKLGIDSIHERMGEFGFGNFTGLDLYEESRAILPSRGWKRATFNESWYIGDTISVGIGQGYWNATPIQIANSLNILVNRGKRFTPTLLKGYLIDGSIENVAIEQKPPLVINNEENWDIVLDALYGTVNRENGTARTAFRKTSYVSAGKTGTAQLFTVAQDEEYDEENVHKYLRDNAMYIGYAPFDNPQISMAVAIENAGGGSSHAAPLARNVMDYYFDELRPAREMALAQKNAAKIKVIGISLTPSSHQSSP